MSGANGAAAHLAEFVSATRYADLPADEQMRTKCRVLDAVLCVLAGQESKASQLAQTQARLWAEDRGPASMWLSGLSARAENAAFVNSILVHSILLDDLPVHAGCVVVPIGLALAEAEGASGAAFLTAVALGYEVELRMDLDHFSHRLMAKGFRHSGVNACYAAVATAASLMCLSSEATANAFGLTTALHNPGTMEPMGKAGSSERFVQMAGNVRAGMLAAALARTGFTGSRETFEARGGLFEAYDGKTALPAGMLDDLGRRWHLSGIGIKPYPCAGTGTVPIYTAEKAARSGISADQVRSIRLLIRPWGPMVGAIDTGPFTNAEQAMVSAPFGVAATLRFGAYNFDTVTAALGDPDVDALAARIEIVAVPEAGKDFSQAKLEVTLADGGVHVFDAGDMPASLTGPLDWAGMIGRFERLTPSLSPAERARIVDAIEGLDRSDSCEALLDCLRGGAG